MNPAREVGRACREAGVPFLLDACQSAGQMPLDVGSWAATCSPRPRASSCAARAAWASSTCGARSSRELEPPFADLHAAVWTANDRFEWRADARRFENWESNIAAKIGLGVAADYAQGRSASQAIQERVTALAARLRDGLRRVPGVTVRDLGPSPVRDRDVRRRRAFARRAQGRAPRARHQRQRHDRVPRRASTWKRAGLESMVRASVHYYNLEAEVDRFCEELVRLV